MSSVAPSAGRSSEAGPRPAEIDGSSGVPRTRPQTWRQLPGATKSRGVVDTNSNARIGYLADSDGCTFRFVDGFTHHSDADREFEELRKRAYGPNPDIDDDPPALARLHELEAAHRADVRRRADAPTSQAAAAPGLPRKVTPPTPPAAPAGRPASAAPPARPADPPPEEARSRSLWQRATATWWRRIAWVAGALVIAGGIVATVLISSAPRPNATLHATTTGSDDRLRSLVAEEAILEIDTFTLRAYGTYRGLEIWSAENAFDSPCLVAMHRENDTLSEWRCAPRPADLIMDVSSTGDGFEGFDGLDGDGIIRFIYHDETVDVFVHMMPEAG